MMKSLKNILKTKPFLFAIYRTLLTFIINMLKPFIKPDKNVFLFVSYGGKSYSDSPRIIYERMIQDESFRSVKYVWAFISPDEIDLPVGRKIQINSFSYFCVALAARCWITNSSVERGLHFKRKNTTLINTWHGSPIKKMGTDMHNYDTSFHTKKAKSNVDYFFVNNEHDAAVFSRISLIPDDRLLRIGYPRNDVLRQSTQADYLRAKEKLHIDPKKKCILYMPTFREESRDDDNNCVFSLPFDIPLWHDLLRDDYVVLVRMHYEVSHIVNMDKSSGFIRNVSDYPQVEDLYLASDMMVSDYSSAFFDYSLQNKPMICYAYDYEDYTTNRGLYFDPRKEMENADDEKELLAIIQGNWDEALRKTNSFRDKNMPKCGNATDSAIALIKRVFFQGEGSASI